ncbi:hypothetical protein ABK040_001536 [Willaertia magna]
MKHGHYAKVVGVVSDNLENLLLEHDCKLKFVKNIIINEYYLDHVRYVCELISREEEEEIEIPRNNINININNNNNNNQKGEEEKTLFDNND